MIRYKSMISVLCQYYGVDEEGLNLLLKNKENLYLVILLMKNLRCLNDDIKKGLGISSYKRLGYSLKKAEEKILINKYFRDEYFHLEENIKEKIKNA